VSIASGTAPGLLPGFAPAAMEGRHDCGPTALLQVLAYHGHSIGREALIARWGFRSDCDRYDTPGHHLRVLAKLAIAHAMRRMSAADVDACLSAGRPVVQLVPRGPAAWHWVVLCGRSGGKLLVSGGDGGVSGVSRCELLREGRTDLLGRAMRVDRIGYVLGGSPPVEHDLELARGQLGLARMAEDWLAPVEPVLGFARAIARKIGWKSG